MPTATAIRYNIVTDDGEPSSATVFIPGKPPLVATRESQFFGRIVQGLNDGSLTEEEIIGLFDTQKGLNLKFQKVSDRVSIRDAKVYFDNMEQENVLAETIIQFYLAGHDDFKALVNFMEKIEVNPNPHSREHLFRWMRNCKFGITPDGDIIAYKGVNRKTGMDPKDEYFKSTHSGPAIVDGQPMNGYIPNQPGTIVEMARNEVTFDPQVTCSSGLHVADWGYASGFMQEGATLMVLVNPRDVVSVPVDAGDKKMRVCRYKVLKRVTSPDTAIFNVDRELQTLTARLSAYEHRPALKRAATTAKKAVKKAAAKVNKKASTKKAAAPVKKAVKAPATKAETKVSKKAPKLPKYYEQFTQEQFDTLTYIKLQWLAKQWDLKLRGARTRGALLKALTAEAKRRLSWAAKDQTKV